MSSGVITERDIAAFREAIGVQAVCPAWAEVHKNGSVGYADCALPAGHGSDHVKVNGVTFRSGS